MRGQNEAMLPPLVLQGIWAPRDMSLRDIVSRALEMFTALGSLSPAWSTWYRYYHELGEADAPETILSSNGENIRRELERGQVKDDAGVPMPQHGFGLGAWAGRTASLLNSRTQLRVRAGTRGHAGPDVLTLEFPNLDEDASRLRHEPLLIDVVGRLSGIWECDWIDVWDLQTVLVRRKLTPNGPKFGWINYLAHGFAQVRRLPSGFRWVRKDECSDMFLFEGGMPSAENEWHRQAFEQLDENSIQLNSSNQFWIGRQSSARNGGR